MHKALASYIKQQQSIPEASVLCTKDSTPSSLMDSSLPAEFKWIHEPQAQNFRSTAPSNSEVLGSKPLSSTNAYANNYSGSYAPKKSTPLSTPKASGFPRISSQGKEQ